MFLIYNREALGIEVDLDLPAKRIIRVLERIAMWRGYPVQIRCDNGPELLSLAMAEWAENNGVTLLELIQKGKPTQNSFVERFNKTYRNEILDFYIFNTLSEVREITDNRLNEYNREGPHESLGNLTPLEYLQLHHSNTPLPHAVTFLFQFPWPGQRDLYVFPL
jgi:putative transposase